VGPTRGPEVAEEPLPYELFALNLGGGVALVPKEDVVGWYGQLYVEGMLSEDPSRAGFVWGFWEGLEAWGSDKAGGGLALPVVFNLGYRNAPLVANLGPGFNLFSIDGISDDGGFGIFSPRAEARIGIQTNDVQLLATGGVQYRWLWGRDDITMFQAGLVLGYTQGFHKQPRPRRRQPS